MKKLLLLPITLLLPACMSTVTYSDPDPAPVVKQTEFAYPHVKRPNLLVADLERSLEIYRDILGFEDAEIGTSGLDSYSYPVFNIPREARMRFVYLGEPGEDRVFGLTEINNVDLPRPADRPYMSTVVIGITGFDEAYEKLRALGLDTTEPRVSGGSEFTFKEGRFVDPDGHMIVIYEVLD